MTPSAQLENEPLKLFSVLLIDDNLEMQNIVELVLNHHHVPLMVASDTTSALDCLNQQTFDIIILDLVLPGMDGYQFFRQIRQQVGSKIIATTAYHTLETPQQVLAWGFDGFLRKPLTPSTLVDYLAGILNDASN